MVIKERMGHKDIKITLNTYGHLYPNEQKKVADMLNRKRNEASSQYPAARMRGIDPRGIRQMDVDASAWLIARGNENAPAGNRNISDAD